MRTKIYFGLIFMSLAVLTAACTAAQAAPASQAEDPSGIERTITVTGVGTVSLIPDIANISIGVQTQNEDAAEAVAENNAMAQEIMETLADFGIAEDDIRTSDFSIWPQQDYDPNGDIRATTYSVQNTVHVTVRDLDDLGDLLDAVVTSGANTIFGINFDAADRTSAEAEALEAAVENADAQAEILAGAANIERGEVLSMSSGSSGPPIIPLDRFGIGGAAAESAVAPISPGQLEIHATVLVVYQIAP
jgi:uncharacterized protein YggE